MRKCMLSLLVILLLLAAYPVFGQELQVVATFTILEDFVKAVGGERVEVHALVGRGIDPHTWEPSPKDARLVAQADLVVANGAGFDQWLLDLLHNAAGSDTPIAFASERLSVSALSHSHHDEQNGHGGDPHFWLSVPNAISYVQQITEALVRLSPADSVYFMERSHAYMEKLAELDRWMQDQLGKIPKENRVIVTYHNAFSYLAERYDFEVAEFLVQNPEAEPSPRELARLVNLLKGREKRALFVEPQLSSGTRYMQTLAREIQGELYTLYSDSLTDLVPTYLDLMKYNTETLVEALK